LVVKSISFEHTSVIQCLSLFKMNIIRFFSFLIIFGLLFLSTTVVYGREDDVEIGDEEEPVLPSDETVTPASDILEGKEEEDPNRIPSSPDFRTIYVFTQPAKANELIAGKLTRLLVGARNNGTQNYVVESIDGSLRYPQDFNYYIQNFTSLRSEKVVEPGLESTFEYLFMPSETFNGRPMGLVVLINYRDNEGKRFQNVVFNQTINFIDAEEGFDGETFFLYIFLGAILILLGFLAYQYFLSNRVKRVTGKLTSQNLATQQTKGNYDVDWIPKHHLIQNRSPKKSPRERKSRQVNGTNSTGAVSSENDE
jgi:translocon-associated protein subunit alpha